MGCKFAKQKGGNQIRCAINGYCYYQYFCNNKHKYVSTASPNKCKDYKEEDVREQKQTN